MYSRRHVSAFLRSSLSAPALGSSSPSQALRVWYTRSPVESPGAQHSESSSPTTSLLLHMWGYDQAHAPPGSGRAGDCPDLILSGEAATPQWMGITSDQSFFRKVTGLVFALAVLACCAAIMLSARGRLRPREVVDERVSDNSAKPMLWPVQKSPPVHFRGLANGVEGGNTKRQAQTSPVGAGPLLPGGNNSRMPEERNLSVDNAGSAVANAVSGPFVNPTYVAWETGGRRVYAEDRDASLQRGTMDAPERRSEKGNSSDVTAPWPFRAP
ncbi:hypothetical protein MTO96_020743 [Rhipicephalus appendiculatus]